MKGGMETAHWAAAAAVVLALVAGCGGRQDTRAASAETGRPAAAAVPIVEVAAARSEPIQATFDAPGTFIPADEATIAAEVAGVIRVVRVEEDSRVRKGEVLAELDRVKAQLAVKQAEAALAQARANFEKAKSELERKKLLLEDRTIAPGTFETFKAQHDAAAAASDGAETALQLAHQRLRDLTVTAPFAGVVKEKKVSPGEYVREGQELLVLMRVDPVKLQFDLPEKYAPRIKEGQQVVATVSAEPGREHTGRIRTVFPAVAVETRSVRAEAIVPNPGYRLKPGFYASVRVPLAADPRALVVPRSALVRREGMENVFVLNGDRVKLVPVQTGLDAGDKIEVLAGLTPHDLVVVAGADTLRDGDRVSVRG